MTFCDIVFVHREITGELTIDLWIEPPGFRMNTNRQYMIFWDDLLVHKGINNFRINQEDLPADLQEALSKTSPAAF
jgi:hypothetical protein